MYESHDETDGGLGALFPYETCKEDINMMLLYPR